MYDVETVERALKAAVKSADDYVVTQTPYGNEGSCAVAIAVHCDRDGKASIISCNLGDSRWVLVGGGGGGGLFTGVDVGVVRKTLGCDGDGKTSVI